MKHIFDCFNAICNGNDLPELPKEEKIFNEKIKFMEAISESTLQLCLSCIVLRAYGVSPDTGSMVSQVISFVTSLASICTAFASVSIITMYY